MQIVIDIPFEVYGLLKYFEEAMGFAGKKEDENDDVKTALMRAVVNGTPLPKGHGDLKDTSKIDYQSGCFISSEGEPLPIIHKIATIEMIRDWLPTIIEADKAESEEGNE